MTTFLLPSSDEERGLEQTASYVWRIMSRLFNFGYGLDLKAKSDQVRRETRDVTSVNHITDVRGGV